MATSTDNLPPVPVTCPTCGATAQATPACRRCRSDLRLLQRLETQRSHERQNLALALATGRWDEALLAAQYMHTLRQDDESFRLLAVCQLLNHQFATAWETHRDYRRQSHA